MREENYKYIQNGRRVVGGCQRNTKELRRKLFLIIMSNFPVLFKHKKQAKENVLDFVTKAENLLFKILRASTS